MKEVDRLIKKTLDKAKADNAWGEVIKDIEEMHRELDRPDYISSKAQALEICRLLQKINISIARMAEGSIVHKLGLRLYDYIDRT